MICFEELVNYYLLEKISKTQQEAGQREMEKENIKSFVQLKKYLFNKWENKKLSKEQIIQKRMEYLRFNYIIELSKEFLVETNQKVIGSYLDWLAGSSDLVLCDKEKGGIIRGNDEKIRKLIVLHEYDRLYEFLKEVIETGEKG